MRYRPIEVATAAGVSCAVLDYWSKVRLVAPTGPGGSYTAVEMSQAIVCGHLHRLGAPGEILRSVVATLAGDPVRWPDLVLIDAAGTVTLPLPLEAELGPDAAWAVRPRRLLARNGPQMMLALSAA